MERNNSEEEIIKKLNHLELDSIFKNLALVAIILIQFLILSNLYPSL